MKFDRRVAWLLCIASVFAIQLGFRVNNGDWVWAAISGVAMLATIAHSGWYARRNFVDAKADQS
jgi:hypothetical protein